MNVAGFDLCTSVLKTLFLHHELMQVSRFARVFGICLLKKWELKILITLKRLCLNSFRCKSLDFVVAAVVRIESKDDCLMSGVDCFSNDFS